MNERFEISKSRSPTESRVVKLYTGAFVRNRADGKNVNFALCCIDARSDSYVTSVDATENLWVANLPNSAVPVRREGPAVAANRARKAGRLLGTLACIGAVIRSRVCVLRLCSERQKRQECIRVIEPGCFSGLGSIFSGAKWSYC